MNYKIKIVYDYPKEDYPKEDELNQIRQREFLFRGKLILPRDRFSQNEIKKIMNQFDYIKKANIVERTIIEKPMIFEPLCNQELTLEKQKKLLIFEALCNRELTLEKKILICERELTLEKKLLIFEALCDRELTLEELQEFITKLKRCGFSSNSNLQFINIKCKPNIYIHKISFESGMPIPDKFCGVRKKLESTYSSYVIYEDYKTKGETKIETKVKTKGETKIETKVKTKGETKGETKIETKVKTKGETKGETKIENKRDVKKEVKPKLQKCISCGGKGVGLVNESGFCDHCTQTKNKLKLYSCSICNKKFSTNIAQDMHLKMKHLECECCGSFGIEKEGGLCKYCIDDAIVYK